MEHAKQTVNMHKIAAIQRMNCADMAEFDVCLPRQFVLSKLALLPLIVQLRFYRLLLPSLFGKLSLALL